MKPFPLGSAAALTVALICGLAPVGCQSTVPPPDWVTDAPPEVGAGDCPVVVENQGVHRMDQWLAGRKRLVEGREEIIRLREPP